tara:strand:- start:4126 stop:6276 length:2151 start_codon:yes stop_codon:yes gene_type:complete
MQGESTKGKRRRKRNRFRPIINLSQERASYFFFVGLLIISIFGCVASGAPKQGFYGIIFVSIGILVALFPPVFMTSKWLLGGLSLFLLSLSASLLPRNFAGSQSWRTNLETLELDTGGLISPHPAATVESIIIVISIITIGLCALGHRIGRDNLLKIATLFVLAVTSYTGISIIVTQNDWVWAWDTNKQFGFFPNANHMATLMVMGSLVCVACLLMYVKKKNWLASMIMIFALGIISWAILGHSISRAGLILFASFQILWFMFIGKRNINHKLSTSFIVLFVLAVSLFLLSDTRLEDRVLKLLSNKKDSATFYNSNVGNNISYLGIRKYIHADTYRMIQSEPWTGIGLGNYEFVFPFYREDTTNAYEKMSDYNVLHPESNWLDLTSQGGVLSFFFALTTILGLLISTVLRNRKSRSWLLCLSCVCSVFCILVHGIFDVPGQKIGIVMSGILLIGITTKPNYNKDKISTQRAIIVYQLLAVGIFVFGLMLTHSQWFSSDAILFSDTKTRINKIQNLYQLSIDSARKKDIASQKKYITAAIDLTDKAIKSSPLDSELHFIRGKLYSFLDGSEDKIKNSFQIESLLDPIWVSLPLRQSKVWLFIDIKETRRLWVKALERSSKLEGSFSKYAWNEILVQAKQHPVLIRDVYEIIIDKDDFYYFKLWMDHAGNKNINVQMPQILRNNSLTSDIKNDILSHWKKKAPQDYGKYFEASLLNKD